MTAEANPGSLITGLLADNNAMPRLISHILKEHTVFHLEKAVRPWLDDSWDHGEGWHVVIADISDATILNQECRGLKTRNFILIDNGANLTEWNQPPGGVCIRIRRPAIGVDPDSVERFSSLLLSALRKIRAQIIEESTKIHRPSWRRRESPKEDKEYEQQEAPPWIGRSEVTETTKRSRNRLPCDIIVIGSSTGGPDALALLLSQMKEPPKVPILITQHVPAGFSGSLARQLSRSSPVPVTEVTERVILRHDQIYLAPDRLHMVVDGTRSLAATLNDGPPMQSCKPSVDVLFQSAAEVCGKRVLALILTGMGYDGLKGCQLLKERGATVFAQDKETSVVWGMPGCVVENNLADKVLPLAEMIENIHQYLEPEDD